MLPVGILGRPVCRNDYTTVQWVDRGGERTTAELVPRRGHWVAGRNRRGMSSRQLKKW